MSEPLSSPSLKQTPAIFTTNRKLEITNLFALVAGGILIKIIFYSQGPANATIWGYTLSAISMFLLLIIAISQPASSSETMNSYLINGLPPILLLIILLWAIGLSISYFNKINKNILPQEFGMYSFISSFLIIVQAINLYMFFNEKNDLNNSKTYAKINKLKEKIQNIDNSEIMYILTILNLVILGMMQIVLTFFTTDG